MSTTPERQDAAAPDAAAVAERFALKALIEACLLVEEGVAGIREIDLGMLAGAGLSPPPFAAADAGGLDVTLAAIERLEAELGERYAAPLLLRRLVNQGRLGRKSGQGFFPYPGDEDEDKTVRLELRELPETQGPVAIVWLDRPPANSISPEVIAELAEAWERLQAAGARVMVLASANQQLFCAGADIKGFATMDEAADRSLIDGGHPLMRGWERAPVITIAAVNAAALGGGCELAMACDIRLAARSASFGQPEINLGLVPGLGGTQRLPRLVGEGRALELNLRGDPIGAEEAWELGLVNAVLEDHELFDGALAWARQLAAQAPLSVAAIKRVSAAGDLDAGIEAEKQAFAAALASADAAEGIAAFLAKRPARFQGR